MENRKARGIKASMMGGNAHSTLSRRMIWGCVQPSPPVSHPRWRSHSCWTWVLGPHNIPHGSDTCREIWIGFTEKILDVHKIYMKKGNFSETGMKCNNMCLVMVAYPTIQYINTLMHYWILKWVKWQDCSITVQVMHKQLTGSPRVFSW